VGGWGVGSVAQAVDFLQVENFFKFKFLGVW